MKPRAKTYEATVRGRKTRVTVPDREEAADRLRDTLRENLNPKAMAVLANAIRMQLNGKLRDPEVRNQLGWLATSLFQMVDERYHALCKEAGL